MPLYRNWTTLKIWVRRDWRTSEWLVSPRQFGYPVTIRLSSFESAITEAGRIAHDLRSRAA